MYIYHYIINWDKLQQFHHPKKRLFWDTHHSSHHSGKVAVSSLSNLSKFSRIWHFGKDIAENPKIQIFTSQQSISQNPKIWMSPQRVIPKSWNMRRSIPKDFRFRFCRWCSQCAHLEDIEKTMEHGPVIVDLP